MTPGDVQPGPWTRRERAAATAILIIYLGLAIGSAVANHPWADEAYTASNAWNLVENGSYGTTNMEMVGTWLTRIDQITYWVLPLYPLASGAWAEVFGPGFLSLRFMNIGWGVLALLAWFAILMSLSRDRTVALVCTGLVGLDYIFVRAASTIRFEMQAVALGWLAIATFLRWRERYFSGSLIIANVLMALALFSHPNAITLFVLLWLAIAAMDFRRLRLPDLVAAAVPYVLCLTAWVWFITRDYQAFHDQFFGNAHGRFAAKNGLWGMLRREIEVRYINTYFGSATLAGPGRLKVLMLAGYVAGIAGASISRPVRRSQAGKFLLGAALVTFLMFTILDGYKNPLYLIYPVPIYVSLLGLVFVELYRSHAAFRALVLSFAGLFLVLNVGGIAMVIRRNSYARAFLPMAEFVKTRLAPGDLVLGAPELQFSLGLGSNVLDDVRLGYDSGKRPTFIVIDPRYREWLEGYHTSDAKLDAFIQHRLTEEYRRTYSNTMYEVYEVVR